MAAAKPLNVLVFTYPEAGQSTTILSLVSELLSRPQPLNIHVASFSELEKRVERLKDGVSAGSSLQFHNITGVTEMDAIWRSGLPHDGNQHPPLTRSNYAFELIPLLLCPWTDAEFEVIPYIIQVFRYSILFCMPGDYPELQTCSSCAAARRDPDGRGLPPSY
jgi:hypothetical protein